MRRPAAVAFDLDGTLIDSRLDIAAACNHVLERAGRATLPPDVIAGFVGDGVAALVSRAFGLPVGTPEVAERAAQLVEYYSAHPVVHTRWMPGALDAMDAVDGAGLPMAIVTNKARAVTLRVLDALGAAGRFACVVAGGDAPLKPRPDMVLAVARALGVEVPAVWVVGDGDQDILSAKAAGAYAVAVRGGFADDTRLAASGPDVTLGSLGELGALVRSAVGTGGP